MTEFLKGLFGRVWLTQGQFKNLFDSTCVHDKDDHRVLIEHLNSIHHHQISLPEDERVKRNDHDNIGLD